MRHRLEFAGKKCIRMMLLLLGVSLAAFLLMAASPLDPLQTNVGQVALGSMSPEQVAQLEDYWGTNTPLPERYLGWLADAVRGDFGTSLLYRRPVLEIIAERLGNSLGLLLFAWGLSGVLGLTLGVTAGALRGRWPDRLIRGWCLLISSTPAFWLALCCQPQVLVLEQGVVTSVDSVSLLMQMCNLGMSIPLAGTVILKDSFGESQRVWNIVGAYLQKYVGPTLNSNQASLAVSRIELIYNGCC